MNLPAKFLITGSEGFIGLHLVNHLIKRNCQVLGLSRRSKSSIQHPNYKLLSGDISDEKFVEAVFNENSIHTIIHLAGVTQHDHLNRDIKRSLEVNTLGTLHLLTQMTRTKTAKFIFASSGKVYGKIRYLPLDESHPAQPQNTLGKIKLINETLMSLFAGRPDQQFVILRIFNIYGPGQKEFFLIPSILSQCRLHQSSITLGDTSAKRDFVYIDDVIDAITQAAFIEFSDPVNFFNIGFGQPTGILQIIQTLENLLGKKISVSTDENRIRRDEFPEEYADIKKFKSLGWEPKFDLRAGLEKILNQDRV